ncbi:putative cellobiohydrolase ii protein [Lasiodiplodia theobromae]|uniref:Glucanase n=1 Tax=Lasiodiplodia theobromae TaxID=45133 RepID=A0A5N5CV95_9PEZI|nr:Beta-d-glucan cellobiohydrolase c [Lasiodiplodia theobromae]KAB2569251.1 putative 1,4-beta-D-glucan cellobiohydrolase C [Lasiodiplodia theobromae]KAF4536178.1 Beta-d-glucan cellobiohydrolase c [Lasiodiplodia theobromae]KAF9634288.1 putative cellobiohydrolase ii protein [Lasiodiplodia theobromae]
MKQAAALALAAVLPSVYAAPAATSSTAATVTAAAATDNPLAGYSFYANAYYASEVSVAAASLSSAGSTALAAQATKVAEVPSFYWLDTRAKIPMIDDFAKDVQTKNAAGAKLTLPLVVYDLPDRDCAAAASNGELAIADDGVNIYKTEYIDEIVKKVKAYPDVFFTLVIEPDSLANLVTNLNVAKCANAADAYKESVTYAIKQLNLDNVAMYLDAGHAGWLGWPANQQPTADLFNQLYKDAGSPKAVRGLATNVSNYNAWSIATCPSYTQGSTICDEKRFINALGPLLDAGIAHFIVDQGRSGKQPTAQEQWGDWCNVKDTGFGMRPTTETDDALLDAIVWVKPGGEADGTSDTSAERYDTHCGANSALKPAPEAGTWFQAYFVQLLQNANPAFS